MIKIKSYAEESFNIIDYKEGLRDEDFCFILETKEGKAFAAKPIGSREIKDEYLKDIDNIIGCKGDVKFFFKQKAVVAFGLPKVVFVIERSVIISFTTASLTVKVWTV